jgi:hypothetical protein
MSKLAKQILAARELEVPVGEWVFIARRPDAMSTASWMLLGPTGFSEKIIDSCVVGWRGVLERDLLGANGSDQEVPFDEEAFRIWVRDRDDVVGPLVNAVLDAIRAWDERLKESRKN